VAGARIEQATEQDVLSVVTTLVDRRYLVERMRRPRFHRGRVFIAYTEAESPAETRAVGYVYLRLERAEEPELRRKLPWVPILEKLRVFDDFRHQGYGRQLVAAAEEYARRRGRRRIALGIAMDNDAAVPFYHRLGYQEWSEGPIKTFREVLRNGSWVRDDELCRVFVKVLPRRRRKLSR
jgi:GNAT superfamily N-acetyltransferase